MTKLFVHWWEDSSGRRTCHENKKGAMAVDSFLGEVRGNDLDGWFYKLKDGEWIGPVKHLMTACRNLEKAVGGVQMTAYD